MYGNGRRDGPAVYTNLSVTTTAAEAKVGASALDERKVIGIQPLDGDIFWGYDSSVTSTTGHKIYQDVYVEIEASEQLSVYLVAASGSIDVRISEIA